jgi:hypothetical protein
MVANAALVFVIVAILSHFVWRFRRFTRELKRLHKEEAWVVADSPEFHNDCDRAIAALITPRLRPAETLTHQAVGWLVRESRPAVISLTNQRLFMTEIAVNPNLTLLVENRGMEVHEFGSVACVNSTMMYRVVSDPLEYTRRGGPPRDQLKFSFPLGRTLTVSVPFARKQGHPSEVNQRMLARDISRVLRHGRSQTADAQKLARG